ncbi:MAG: T9SS type A sorting domain-containing protein [Bacteroidota bacterium]
MKSSSVVLLLRYCTAFALLLYLPATGFSQLVTVNGNIKFFVGTNQGLQVPDGIVVLDNAINILPPTLMLSDGAVLLGTPAALYKVHSVPDDGNAVFYSAFSMDGRPATERDAATVATPSSLLGSRAGLTIVNGSSGVSDFTLKLDAVSGLGTSCLPVVWEVSQTTGSGIGDVTFTWDASLEPVTLTNKKLYKYASGAWTVLPAANTTTGTYSLTYSGYTDALSSTRFGIASGLSVTPTPTDPLCTGGTGSLTVSVDGGLGTRSYKLGSGSWQSSNQFTGLVAGTYTVYVKDDAGNEESSMVTITDPPPVTANVTGDLTVCSGESTTLTATGGTSYVWNGTLGTNAAIMVSPATTTTYSVSVTDANSCLSTASVTVQIYVVQPPVITYTDNTGLNDNNGAICAGSVSTVDITGGASYVWSDGSTSSSRTLAPACTTPYNLTVTDINGCTITANLQITVNYEPSVTQITPSTGSTGTTITINGKNLDNVSAVKFNGQTASGLTIVNATQLKANLPSGGALTQVQLLSPCGTTTIPVATPTITMLSPGAGYPGTMITLTGTNLDQLTSASAGGVPAVILSRSATSARILVMPGAATGSVSVTNIASTATAPSSFTVNTSLYPYFQQGAKLTNSGTNAIQGSYVSVSADGNTAIIGAPGDDGNKGAAWIYTRSGSSWTQQAKLVGTGAAGAAKQGTGVAISANGNTAVVGGPADNSNAGAVWVFTRTGTTWTQQGGKLVGTGASGAAQQGINVAVSGDGNTIASGGFADRDYTGAAWTFARYGSGWSQLGDKITGNDNTGSARQGASLSLSANGSRLLMGGYQDNNRQGAVWTFDLNDCDWVQQGPKLVGTGGTSQAWQGYSVSLSADGKTAVVGGNSDNNLAGAAWVFTDGGSGNRGVRGFGGGGSIWTQQARLVGTQAAGLAKQGNSVSLSADGNVITVGGSADDSNKGAVWVYRKNGSNWTQQGAKIKGNNAVGSAKQGSSVSLSANGTTAIIGGPTDNTNKGAFWVYVPATTIPSMQQVLFEERTEVSAGLHLDQNIPNPFTGSTTIGFSVPEACVAEWEITDVSGRVIQLLRRAYAEGENTESFDLSGNSGVFYYRLKTPYGTAVKKMLIVN